MTADQYACLSELEERLAREGIERFAPQELSDRQMRMVQQVFENEIASVLAPWPRPLRTSSRRWSTR